MHPPSAIPDFYYAIFAVYEPFLCILGFAGALVDPKKTHDMQAPWPSNRPPADALPRATLVTLIQLGHVCALLGVVNYFVLSAAREHLATLPIIQERVVGALLAPLLVGDILHIALSMWAIGEDKWHPERWSATLWTMVILGFSLMIPRIAWWSGIGRFVARRDAGLAGPVLDKAGEQ